MKIGEHNYISQLKKHNEKALMYVIDQYGGLIQSVIRKRLYLMKQYEEECLDDVLMAIWENIDCYEEEKSTFANWAAGIARYKAIDYLRKYKCELWWEELDERDAGTASDVYDSLSGQELSEETEQILSFLSEEDRKLFCMLFAEEMDVGQVSEETGMKKEVIYNHISRGRRKLRTRFSGKQKEEL